MKKTKPKKPKLGKKLRQNLMKAQELLTKVQTLVEQGKGIEDPEIQQVIQDLMVLTQDVSVARAALTQALSRATVTKRMIGHGI